MAITSVRMSYRSISVRILRMVYLPDKMLSRSGIRRYYVELAMETND